MLKSSPSAFGAMHAALIASIEVGHVGEVAALLAVAGDDRRLAVQQRGDELADDRRVDAPSRLLEGTVELNARRMTVCRP